MWKITERDKKPEGYNLKDEEGKLKDLCTVTSLQVSGWRVVFSIQIILHCILGNSICCVSSKQEAILKHKTVASG